MLCASLCCVDRVTTSVPTRDMLLHTRIAVARHFDTSLCRRLLVRRRGAITDGSTTVYHEFSAAVEDDGGDAMSNRSRFRSIPLNPSILKHIQNIGVGIPDRKQQSRERRRERPPRTTTRRKAGGALIDPEKEEEFLRRRGRAPLMPRRQSNVSSSSENSDGPSWVPPPPFAASSKETTHNGKRVRRRPVRAIASIGSLDDSFPVNAKRIPEVALAGRSNSGKSTLLNALLYGNNISVDVRRRRGKVPEGIKLPKGVKAVTSNRPGETQSITFYQLSSSIRFPDNREAELAMHLVDLPGYGFAYAEDEQSKEWGELMHRYLLHRGKALKRILFLVDARHGMKKADVDFLESLERTLYSDTHGTRASLPPIQLVLTKCDLVSQTDLARRAVLVREQLSECLRREPSLLPVMLVSAKAGVGYNNIHEDRARGGVLELQREIAALALSWTKKADAAVS